MQKKSPSNPFIHGTSSETLSMMRHTEFKLMPVLHMLEEFKIAPMVGEIKKGGLSTIGEGSNRDSLIGAPAFGKIWGSKYNLTRIINNYTKHRKPSKSQEKRDFDFYLENGPKTAFNNLNALMIYWVRLKQLGISTTDFIIPERIQTLKNQLAATIQFYYFILCVQQHIFIDVEEIQRFKSENNVGEGFAIDYYLEHFFSFEKFLEKLTTTSLDIKEIYENPSEEKINRLIEFLKIPKDAHETFKIGFAGQTEINFISPRDYHFFTLQQHAITDSTSYSEIGGYLFGNVSGYSFADYFTKYYKNATSNRDKYLELPDFLGFHGEILKHITALTNRIQLFESLLTADDNEFKGYDEADGLVTDPFPVIFVTAANTIEPFHGEYRSRSPLQLGQDICLVATDNKTNQKRLRNYLQKNGVGPVEVLLFPDLYQLKAFDPLLNKDLSQAFHLASTKKHKKEFTELYHAIAELNEKCYRFKDTNPPIHAALNEFIAEFKNYVLTENKSSINFKQIKQSLEQNKAKHYNLYATHRGILGTIDTILTILTSLIIFYPVVYLVQKNRKSTHTFFATDTAEKIDNALRIAENISNQQLLQSL